MLRLGLFRGSNFARRAYGSNSTALKEEIDKFRNVANTWWDVNGGFKPLHSMNSLRIPFIQDGLINSGRLKRLEYPKPLKGIHPLARLGATVTGLDATEESIAVAKSHNVNNLNINYIFSTSEKFLEENPDASFDAIVASEVIEHVDNPELFLKTASKLLKPNGSLFLTTVNRTRTSYLAAIIAAEYVLGIVPKGTHEWNRFRTPEEIQVMLSNCDVETRMIHGMSYNPISNNWSWTRGTSVDYALHAVKPN
ncbi:unnamed protein product [Allacma fusca]|uniref:Ubiquinone biosynthesis O-methyltransferase, mitochondrial n=1 Tax=Allacma fusca TaxID=39272 RepID=A0A8J2LLU6_9HEXA|nr:unnamed protein product [Allacma fusca]